MELRKRSLLGSTNSCVDLSMVDNSGYKRTSMTTANCYMVHSAGQYKLPLVYGNSIKNGQINTTAFYPNNSNTQCLNRFINHNGTGITGPWITKNGTGINAGMGLTVVSADLLWQDTQNLVSAISIENDYLLFTIGTFNHGNAVIAVKNNSGTIIWQWHIWVTTETFTSTTVISTGSHNYTVAPTNLGWVPTGGEGKQGYCPIYQFGNLNPEVPCNGSLNGNVSKTVYNLAGEVINVSNISRLTCKNLFNDDYVYINIWDASTAQTFNVSTATTKTIYDPCPPGFCVPTSNLFVFMGSISSILWDNTNKGATWNESITGDALWFPAVGCGYGNNSSFTQVGSSIFLWSATAHSTSSIRHNARDLKANSSKWNHYYNSSYNANPIRPVLEE